MDTLQRQLTEAYQQLLTEESLEAVRNACKIQGVEVDAYISTNKPNTITLSRIVVPKENRGKGLGTTALRALIKFADDNEKTITLTPSTDFGASSVARLRKFYKDFGFVDNSGRNKDFSISDTMYRLPIVFNAKQMQQSF